MQALPACVNVFSPRAEGLNAAEEAYTVWKRARALITSPDEEASAQDVARAVLFLASWRLHSSRALPETQTCGFVATCALRMAVIDAFVRCGFQDEVLKEAQTAADSMDDRRIASL